MTTHDKRESSHLQSSPLFAALDDEAAVALRRAMIKIELERGEVLFRAGDQADSLYVIGEGRIKVGRTHWDGRHKVVTVLGPGDVFGELSLFDGGARTMTTTAVGQVVLFRLSGRALDRLLTHQPRVAVELLQSLARRLRTTNDLLADLVFLDVPGRVAKALLDLANRFGENAVDGVVIRHEMTQNELADLAGTSRETVNRALATFADRGWLTYAVGEVFIRDIKGLRRRAGEQVSVLPS